jgi:hypothetical protein
VNYVVLKKPKKEKQESAIQRTVGVLKSNRPALTPQQEREAAEEAIAEEAIQRMGR